MTRTYEDAVGSVWPNSVCAACSPAPAIDSDPMSPAAAATIRVRGALKFSGPDRAAAAAPSDSDPALDRRPASSPPPDHGALRETCGGGSAAQPLGWRGRLAAAGPARGGPRHPATASAPAVLERRLGISETTRKSPDDSDHDPVRGPMRPGAPS
jgi:hypothetical protein